MGDQASLMSGQEYFLDEFERAKRVRDVSNVKFIIYLAEAELVEVLFLGNLGSRLAAEAAALRDESVSDAYLKNFTFENLLLKSG